MCDCQVIILAIKSIVLGWNRGNRPEHFMLIAEGRTWPRLFIFSKNDMYVDMT